MDKEARKDPEKNLLEKVAQKDKTAFETLYQLTSQSVFFYLLRLLQNRETAEDIHVEVFCQVWKSAEKFKGQSKVKTWIFGIARNLAYNDMRREKIRKTQELYDIHRDESTSREVQQFAQKQHMQAAMEKLSPKHREILDLVFFHELSYSEISALLDIPENTVKTRVYYAKDMLRNKLLEMEV